MLLAKANKAKQKPANKVLSLTFLKESPKGSLSLPMQSSYPLAVHAVCYDRNTSKVLAM